MSITIGTRGSPLARAQAEEVRARLIAAHPALAAEDAIRTEIIMTSGDRFTDRPLADIGGKGLFTKEIEDALLDGRIDIAVHSMKDMPTVLPDGLVIDCILPREDPRDVLIGEGITGVGALPKGARVGTASLRRQAQLLHCRPDLDITMLRGNVQTRLSKVAAGEVDATLLAYAGLRRLSAYDERWAVLGVDELLPAVAQGAIGIECRAGDESVAAALAPLNCATSASRVAAERALLAELDGSCRTPIAALAEIDEAGMLHLRALIATPDGKTCHATERRGPAGDAVALGCDAGAELKTRGGADFFAHLP